MTTWREFWDSAHSIYVSDRHKDVHYRDVAEQLAAFVPQPDARVLDYGCGEAIHADLVAERARANCCCATPPRACAPRSRRALPAIRRSRCSRPRTSSACPTRSLDLIFANSLVQYLTAAELDRMLALWRRLLAPRRHADRRRRDPAACRRR